ncbi:MAG: anthranilate synthase component II [Alphaproteobacteria bacterium]
MVKAAAIKTLLIDNYDSFTYNLYHYASMAGAEVTVVRNDALTVDGVLKQQPDAIILSPGPCTPNEAGICLDLIPAALEHDIPLLGICLGHQSIGQAFGGRVIRAPQPVHGKVDQIYHEQEGLFTGLPSPLLATRYHSLIVEASSLPNSLVVQAKTTDGLIMALKHRKKPIFGLQFHPESIATEHGTDLIVNFLQLAQGAMHVGH